MIDTSFFYHQDHNLMAEDVEVSELAGTYSTPLYVYSAGSIRRQYKTFYDTLSKVCETPPFIAYACKANDRIAILKLMNTLGAGIDVVSAGEMQRALAAGIPADRIIFSGVGKTISDLQTAAENGIRHINIESEPELHLLAEVTSALKKPMDILFRLNPDVEAGTHDKISTGRSEDKFGLTDRRIRALYKAAKKMRYVNPVGLSMHIGSQVVDPRYFIPAFEKIQTLVEDIRKDGHTITELDIGGGLGITYRDEPEADIEAYANLIKDMLIPLGCRLSFEPGRYLVGNAGILVTRVIYVKRTAIKTHIIVDAAMNDLLRPALYDAYHVIRPVRREDGREVKPVDIVGPVCESGDTFAKDRPLPIPLQNELLAIYSTGAYGATMASYYNARPPATEVLVDGAHHDLIYKPESIESQIEREMKL